HASAVAGRYGYDGGLSLDFRRDAKGLVALECNPRPTAGVHLMSDEAFEDALLGTPDRLHVTPPGIRRKYSAALVRDIALHFADADQDLRHLFSDAREVVATWDDPLPALYQFFSYSLVVDFRKRHGGKATPTDLAAAYFDHVAFDGPEHRAVS
ncbi:MAG TPA: hypothetical protein VL400_00950, partial [Polyangiaceae bacterium]|nr:hypothetical protein [Polyangiaceae bacterium]